MSPKNKNPDEDIGHLSFLGPPKSTNLLHLKIPIICRKKDRGENISYLDSASMAPHFNLEGDIEIPSIAPCDKIKLAVKPALVPTKVDPITRALQYKTLIEDGFVKNQSELPACLRRSRAWVSRVMRILRGPEY
ncbi:MAG TPA: hypothetical protein VLX91_08435 [Candidatus Acidoferrales bacterium]|nr:hypothetical protein [Candidatus Acidoferrales bacterium]